MVVAVAVVVEGEAVLLLVGLEKLGAEVDDDDEEKVWLGCKAVADDVLCRICCCCCCC